MRLSRNFTQHASLPFSLPLLGLQFGVTELRFAQDVTRDMIADNKLVSCKY